MHFIKLVLCFTILSLCHSSVAMSPSQMQIDQFKKLPLSQQKALAKQYGIDLQKIEHSKNEVNTAIVQENIPIQPREVDALEKSKFNPKKEELKKFGYELFAGEPMSFMPSESAAVSDFYPVGPGDEFQINLVGKESGSSDVIVDREGRLKIPGLSPINVTGLVFSEAKKLIKSKIEEEIIGVKAFISMGSLRTIRILVLGEAYKPGSYMVSSLASVTHALMVSGGVTEIGSLRNIQIKRNGVEISRFDLYELLMNGDSSGDIVLKSGDVVFIPPVSKLVSVSGLVNRPAIFELKENETASDLIRFAGGFKIGAFPPKTIIERFTGNSSKMVLSKDFSADTIDYVPKNGDVVKVQASGNTFENSVTLVGAVSHPGQYEWRNGYKITDLVKSFKRDILPIADLDYSLIVREKNIKGDIELHQFSLYKALNDTNKDPELRPNDVVLVFSRFEEKEAEKQLLSNLALSESELEYNSKVEKWNKFENKEFHKFIGEEFEDEQKLEESVSDDLTNLFHGNDRKLRNKQLSAFSREKLLSPIILKLRNQASHDRNAAIFDIDGQVTYPGVYPLVVEPTFYKAIVASGGLKESAYLERAEVSRKIIGEDDFVKHIDLNLTDFLNGKKSFELKSKDSIHIFTIPNWSKDSKVRLFGEVKFPGTYSIGKGESINDLIERAGGLTEFAAPNAAIFTRLSIQNREKEQLRKLADDLRREIRAKSFSASINDSSLSYDETNKLLNDLTNSKALGRLIIDLPNLLAGQAELKLESGDTLYIPSAQNTVSVVGEVNVSSSHLYDQSLTLNNYLNLSGGLKQRADESSIYVIRANGSVYIPNQRSWFAVSNNLNNLQPGDTIVVPLDTEHMNQLTLWSTATQIVYQLGLAAAAISAL